MGLGKGYNEQFFDFFATISGALKFLNVRLYGTTGSSLNSIAVKSNGELGIAQSYTLGYNGSNQLTTIVRSSDSKTLTLGYTGSNLTSISDWA